MKTRTARDLEADLIRAVRWRDDFYSLVRTPEFDLERLAAEPDGVYADEVVMWLEVERPR